MAAPLEQVQLEFGILSTVTPNSTRAYLTNNFESNDSKAMRFQENYNCYKVNKLKIFLHQVQLSVPSQCHGHKGTNYATRP